jgi:DNA-directed RNA polymerase specialized sigma24 family protein
MDADSDAPDGPGPDLDPESIMRQIASLRTYLIVVAGRLAEGHPPPGRGVSDLVHSVLVDAFDEVRNGDGGFTFRSFEELKAWLVNRLRWAHQDGERRRRRYERVLQALPPRRGPRTPGSEVASRERDRLRAEARAKLDPADRQLIEWRIDEGLTFREIGRRRGYSTSYARRAWLGARRRFRSIYQGLVGALST